MENLILYRNLPFDVWHTPFKDNGSKWRPGFIRQECSCPYGKHGDHVCLDYKDPIHFKEILALKPGSKLLIFANPYEVEKTICRKFRQVEFLSDFARLCFEPVQIGLDWDAMSLASIRWIVVLPEGDQTPVFEKQGGIKIFVEEVSKATRYDSIEILKKMKELTEIPVDQDLKISIDKVMKEAKSNNIYVYPG